MPKMFEQLKKIENQVRLIWRSNIEAKLTRAGTKQPVQLKWSIKKEIEYEQGNV